MAPSVWMCLSLALQRIGARVFPTWNPKPVSVFGALGFRRFLGEPGENFPSADESITNYNWF